MSRKQNNERKAPPGSKTNVIEILSQDGIKSYLRPFTRFVYYLGLWTRSGRFMSPLFYFIAPAYLFFFAISFMEVSHNWGDLSAMTETLDMTLIFSVTGHKALHLMWFHKEWRALVDVVEGNYGKPHQRENVQHRVIMDASVRLGKRVGIFWGAYAGATLTSFTIMPMAQSLLLKGRRTPVALVAFNTSEEEFASPTQQDAVPYLWAIPYRTWTPFDDWTGIPYVLVYLLHLYIASLQVMVVPVFDSLMIALINYTCGQFRILQMSLLHIRRDCKEHIEKNGVIEKNLGNILLPEVLPDSEDTEATPLLDKEMHSRIKEYVDHHETLLFFVQNLEEMVNKILLNQFFASSVIICTSAFQLTMRHIGVAKLISMAELLTAALIEMGMFCYFSNLLIDEKIRSMSEEFHIKGYFLLGDEYQSLRVAGDGVALLAYLQINVEENDVVLLTFVLFSIAAFGSIAAIFSASTLVGYTVYCSEWFHSSIRFRRSASLIMSRARRPCFITFGGFSPLSMETYASILRISYTYFTVLNGMNE